MTFLKKTSLLVICTLILTACGAKTPNGKLSYESKILANNDCKCSVQVPVSWDESMKFHPDAMIQAGSLDSEELFMVLSIPKGKFKEIPITDYGKYVIEGIEQSSEDFKNHRRDEVSINGLKGVQYEIYAVLDKQETTNIFTFLEDEENFYQIVAWSTTEGFPLVEKRLIEVSNTFTVMP